MAGVGSGAARESCARVLRWLLLRRALGTSELHLIVESPKWTKFSQACRPGVCVQQRHRDIGRGRQVPRSPSSLKAG
jgi:hypothetical protein